MSILDSIKEAEAQAAAQRQSATIAARETVQQAQTKAKQEVEELIEQAQQKAVKSVEAAGEQAEVKARKQIEDSAMGDEEMTRTARNNLDRTAQFIVERVQS